MPIIEKYMLGQIIKNLTEAMEKFNENIAYAPLFFLEGELS